MKKSILQLTILLLTSVIANSQTNQSKPLIIGNVDEIYSTALGENRILNIYFPEGYKKNDSIKYPVIYILDGSIDEDFIHIMGIIQYNNFSWINRVPKSIVVGIANVDRRRDFTSPTNFEIDKKHSPNCGGSSKFINFIENELQPYINKKYNTNNQNTIIGQSLGGLVATEILFTKPYLFDKYIIISPSLWWNDGSLLKTNPEILSEKFSKHISIYIGVGKEGLTPGLDNHVMEVDANLLADKIKQSKSKSIKVYFDYLPLENHATVTHPAVFNAFRLLYPQNEE
ncbi:MAG: alpha/beta hydrolase [Bacteroidia bacterium]|nr:alpha/beta hydrolase [Bacteroidia bacterium]